VRSVLSSDYANFELLVVDQSDDSATANQLAPLVANSSRVSLLPMVVKGKPAALNHALGRANGQYLALTDDDCEVARNWISALVAALEANPNVGAVFGDVAAAPFDEQREHTAQTRIEIANTIHHPNEFLIVPIQRGVIWLNFGIGANMALRTRTMLQLGGWDPCIGPGAKFDSGDDHDLAFRILCKGYGVHFCPQARVVHHGARSTREWKSEYVWVGRGFGAAFAKYLRCALLYRGSLRTLRINLLGFFLHALQMRRTQPGCSRFIRGWIGGFAAGLFQPLEKATLCFEEVPERQGRHANAEYGAQIAKCEVVRNSKS
jgi:GT2 family glycosyltransferase